MKIPAFKPSGKFLDEYDVPCLIAKVKNSKLPGVATRYIAELKEDPTCTIYLRGKNPKDISPWQQQMLEQLLEQEGLAPAIAAAMSKYEKRAGKEAYTLVDAKEHKDFKRHGIVPFMTVSDIVIDGIRKEVIINARCDPAPHFSEHGLNLYLKKGQWNYDEGEYLLKIYRTDLGPTAEEREDQVESEKWQNKWDALYPPAAPGTPVKKDCSHVCGRWEVDEAASLKLRQQLGLKPDLSVEAYYVISETTAETNHSQGSIVTSERRGNWCTINAKSGYSFTLYFWSDGDTLVNPAMGQVFRRRDRWGELFALPQSGAAVQTDPGFVGGDWQFDDRKTVEVLKQLGRWNDRRKSELESRRSLDPSGYRFSAGTREKFHQGELGLLEPPREILGWQRKGNRVTIQHRKAEGKPVVSDEFWCDGKFLVERTGYAYRRAENLWPNAVKKKSDEAPSYAELLPRMVTQMLGGKTIGKKTVESLGKMCKKLGKDLDTSMKQVKRLRK